MTSSSSDISAPNAVTNANIDDDESHTTAVALVAGMDAAWRTTGATLVDDSSSDGSTASPFYIAIATIIDK